MAELETKAIVLEIKEDSDSPGGVTAVFATFDEIDRDGEITRPGAFGSQDVLLGGFGHASVGMFGASQPPIGRGTVSERTEKGKKRGIFDGQFNLDMVSGRETYESVKFSGNLQEWSYGFRVTKESFEEIDDRRVRIIEKAQIFEVSPVLVGAGFDTHTVGIKNFHHSMPIDKHCDVALDAWSSLIGRLKSLADLRATEGRTLSAANRTRLSDLQARLSDLTIEIDKLLADAEPPGDREKALALSLYADYQRIWSKRHAYTTGT